MYDAIKLTRQKGNKLQALNVVPSVSHVIFPRKDGRWGHVAEETTEVQLHPSTPTPATILGPVTDDHRGPMATPPVAISNI